MIDTLTDGQLERIPEIEAIPFIDVAKRLVIRATEHIRHLKQIEEAKKNK
jgi:hypothetical protein